MTNPRIRVCSTVVLTALPPAPRTRSILPQARSSQRDCAPASNIVDNEHQRFLRENWISNRIFSSYGDILDHCCEAWNKLTDQPWLIMSIGLRNWAHRF